MGLTPMDLFNDILTTESDLKNFLEQNSVKCANGVPGMVIQAYLVFCQQINLDFLLPIVDIMIPVKPTDHTTDLSSDTGLEYDESFDDDEDLSHFTANEDDDEDDDDLFVDEYSETGFEEGLIFLPVYIL